MSYPILEYFKYEHLPPHLREASKPFCDLAHEMAKDCFVRAVLSKGKL